jgi:hypothetical protein
MSSKYFFTRESCSVPLNSLSLEEIKKSYSNELSKFGIKRNRYYNLVAKTLGYQDWTIYKEAYEKEIIPFLEQKGLKKYTPKCIKSKEVSRPIGKDGSLVPIVSEYEFSLLQSKNKDIKFSYRQIADRIFLSEQITPNKIFTGYNSKIFEKVIKEFYKLGVPDFSPLKNLIGDTFLMFHDNNKKEYVAQSYIKNSHITKLHKLVFSDNKIKLTLKDFQYQFDEFCNNLKSGLYNQDIFQDYGKFINGLLNDCQSGWIEIIKFNENLFFLKAKNGNYDFVFKNLRDEKFTSKFQKYIKHKYIPSLVNEEYDFNRWLYFGYKEKNKNPKNIKPFDIWLERDEHLSEIEYYQSNKKGNYPGLNQILKDFYKRKGVYSYYEKSSNNIINGFKPFDLEDKTLYVSDLITIEEFDKFKIEYNYIDERSEELEDLSVVNQETKDTPVSVTLYDAIAYCKYIENKYKIQARLLYQDEYELICPSLVYKKHNEYQYKGKDINGNEYTHFDIDVENELNFFFKNNKLPSPPPSMNPEQFDKVVMKLAKPLKYIKNNGLKFCVSCCFNEWTNEYYDNESKVVHARYPFYKEISGLSIFLASSTMKYQYRKVGFRVCYTVAQEKANQ